RGEQRRPGPVEVESGTSLAPIVSGRALFRPAQLVVRKLTSTVDGSGCVESLDHGRRDDRRGRAEGTGRVGFLDNGRQVDGEIPDRQRDLRPRNLYAPKVVRDRPYDIARQRKDALHVPLLVAGQRGKCLTGGGAGTRKAAAAHRKSRHANPRWIGELAVSDDTVVRASVLHTDDDVEVRSQRRRDPSFVLPEAGDHERHVQTVVPGQVRKDKNRIARR